MKIALVHDYLVQHGGAESVLKAFLKAFPDAAVYTLLYDRKLVHGAFDEVDIITSSLQKMPFARTRHRSFPPLMPQAIEEFDFTDYDIILSDSSSFAKGIITSPETLHVSYVHTPMRYAWDDCQKYTSDFGLPSVIERIVPFIMNPIRMWDYASAQRVDHFLANSRFVEKRIRKYYHNNAEVLHPPVNTDRFSQKKKRESGKEMDNDYYLMVGRLIAYKRHDVAIKAFNELGLPLKIAGRGPEKEGLQKIAKENIEFLGRVPDADLPTLYQNCKGFIFPQEEDFGIVAIEALASGKPLIAYRGGDIVEHVEDGIHGILFEDQTVESLTEAIVRFESSVFNSDDIAKSVEHFDTEIFCDKIKHRIEELYREHQEVRRAFLAKQRLSAEEYNKR